MVDQAEGQHGRYPKVLSPIKLGPVEIPTRTFFAPHGIPLEAKSPHGSLHAEPAMNRAYYFGDRAKGGTGLIIHSTQVLSSQTNFSESPAREESIPAYQRVAHEVHKHGAKIFAEVWYVNWIQKAWEPLGPEAPGLAPTALPTLYYPSVRREMTHREIDMLVEVYRTTTRNLKAAGYDGIELHVSHGAALEYFLSPYFNKRTDEYGGSMENRARLMVRMLEMIRSEQSSDQALGIRINADELLKGGLDEKATQEVILYLEKLGLLDFVDLDVSVEPEQADLMTTGMFDPILHNATRAARVGQALAGRLPVLMTPGRLTSMADAENLIESGMCDVVGMARGLIAEPELVNKSREGREDERRVCVAVNACVDGLSVGWGCAINPTAGKENRWGLQFTGPTPSPKKVVVVGGGPAGLEAARIAATRGNSVTLFEKGTALGGGVIPWSELPGRKAMQSLPVYFTNQMKLLGVDVRLSTEATPEAILAEKADVVFIATGSRYSREGLLPIYQVPLPGHDRANVHVPEDIFGGKKLSGKVVVIDDEGYHTASGLAEKLAGDGCEVVYVTRKGMVAASLGLAIGRIAKRLNKAGVTFLTGMITSEIADTSIRLYDPMAEKPGSIDGVDHVVLATCRLAVDGLFAQLDGKVPYLYLIGDALAPRALRDVIYDGHRFGRVVGEPDMPLYVQDELFRMDPAAYTVSAAS